MAVKFKGYYETLGVSRGASDFFLSRSWHTRYWRDWSSDVCSSDLLRGPQGGCSQSGEPFPVHPPLLAWGGSYVTPVGESRGRKQLVDDAKQLVGVERLFDEPGNPRDHEDSGGDHHHRDIGEFGIGSKYFQKLIPVHHRHHQVEQHQSRFWNAIQNLESFGSVCRRACFVTLVFEDFLQRVANVEVILDDQDRPGRIAVHRFPLNQQANFHHG